jgi:hypothetical protein
MNTKIISMLLKLIFPITFNVIFLLILIFAESVHAPAWIAWLFVNIAYGLILVQPYVSPQLPNSTAANYIVYAIAYGGFAIILLLGFLFMAINPQSGGIFVFVLFFILTMIIVASILVYQLMNHKAAVSLNGQIDATNNIRSMAFDLESVSSLFSDPIQKQALLSLVDFIKASPSLSNDSVKEYEDEAADLIHQIVSKIKAGEHADYTAMIENVKVALKNRNNKLKMMG